MNNKVHSCYDGIILNDATAASVPSNEIIGNHVVHSSETGIGLTGSSSQNLVKGNHIRASGAFDLFDDSMNNNIWEENKYKTANWE
jgi:parallel beta-helix repeat protein